MPGLVNGVHFRTLLRAMETLGSKERLATALGIGLADLEAYMAGRETVPIAVFIDALDIVALRSGHACKREG
jgi:hypothetical protein